MSRVANAPIVLPAGVDIKVVGKQTVVKGKLGELSFQLSPSVDLEVADNVISVKWDDSVKGAKAHAGTARASINNMVKGVSEGFVKRMLLVASVTEHKSKRIN